jgi:hypothetical protein
MLIKLTDINGKPLIVSLHEIMAIQYNDPLSDNGAFVIKYKRYNWSSFVFRSEIDKILEAQEALHANNN